VQVNHNIVICRKYGGNVKKQKRVVKPI